MAEGWTADGVHGFSVADTGSGIPPEIVASPTIVKVTNLAPTSPNVVSYAAPAALRSISAMSPPDDWTGFGS